MSLANLVQMKQALFMVTTAKATAVDSIRQVMNSPDISNVDLESLEELRCYYFGNKELEVSLQLEQLMAVIRLRRSEEENGKTEWRQVLDNGGTVVHGVNAMREVFYTDFGVREAKLVCEAYLAENFKYVG